MDQKNTERPTLSDLETELKREKQRSRPTIAQLEALLAEEKQKQERKHKVKPVREKKPRAEKPVKEPKAKKEKPVWEPKAKKEKPVREKKPKEEKPVEPKAAKPVKEKPAKREKKVKDKKQKLNKTARFSPAERPDQESLEQAVSRQRRRRIFFSLLRKTFVVLITVAAVAALVATLFMPVLKVYSGSMAPGMLEGDIVVALKEKTVENGEVIAFYYNNKLFIKRVVAGPGETVVIDEDGYVYVNDVLLDEPYVEDRSAGVSDLVYPYTVPDGSYFVLGDSRVNSSDSRSTAMGCVSTDDILGRVLFRVWPLNRMSGIH